jgi:hypothetical protein
MRAIILSVLFLFSSASAQLITVQPVRAIAQGVFQFGTGSLVNVQGLSDSGNAIFLGQLVRPDSSLDSYMFLSDDKIYYVDASSVDFQQTTGLERVLKLYEQEGGTCTAYAIDDYLQQTNFAGFTGNGKLAQTLSTEEGRTQLLVDAVNQYYLTPQHKYSIAGILNGYGKNFDFTCRSRSFNDADAAISFVQEQLTSGHPILISFNLGPDMATSPFTLVNFNAPTAEMDQRLWIPRKVGERNSGAHTVVAAAIFSVGGHPELLMLDSDWPEPRIWDVDAFIGPRTAIQEIEFVTCH